MFDWLVSLTAQSLNPNAKLPVIVFIHGGAFIFGSSNDAGPEYLLEGKLLMKISTIYRHGHFI